MRARDCPVCGKPIERESHTWASDYYWSAGQSNACIVDHGDSLMPRDVTEAERMESDGVPMALARLFDAENRRQRDYLDEPYRIDTPDSASC